VHGLLRQRAHDRGRGLHQGCAPAAGRAAGSAAAAGSPRAALRLLSVPPFPRALLRPLLQALWPTTPLPALPPIPRPGVEGFSYNYYEDLTPEDAIKVRDAYVMC
jgi:hypothetical protein